VRKIATTGIIGVMICAMVAPATSQPMTSVKANPFRDVYFGDLHLHTSYSFDAYLLGAGIGPDDAYRFASGGVVDYMGQPVRRREPLDFMAVTDHAENIGVFDELENPKSVVSQSDAGKLLKSDLAPFTAQDGSRRAAEGWPPPLRKKIEDYMIGAKNQAPPTLQTESISAWNREINAANRFNEPGKFTTLIAYEWTSMPGGSNLHRNIIFKGNSAPPPFTAFDSKKPEDLWHWLDTIRKEGFEALAIPHNSNFSNGLMYDWVDSNGRAIDEAYAEERQANEPLTEISQIKGSSETQPLLSPDDEFANFEIVDPVSLGITAKEKLPGSYVRDALGRGLVIQQRVGVNPFKFGFAGGSDLHSGLSVSDQSDYSGNAAMANMGGGRPSRDVAAGVLQATSVARRIGLESTSGRLTGVWAESNTRESIYNALRRKETFATSGTKLKFRVFGGWQFNSRILQKKDWVAAAYATGVPMGGDLPSKLPSSGRAPGFVIWAAKDPSGANLDRVQMVKVWVQDGVQHEKIFDVAWAGHRKPDRNTGKLSPIGNSVDLKTGRFQNNIGTAELKTVWTDPEFDPRRSSAYYLRVLEISTPRWSTLLAVENRLPLPTDVPAVIQQRGWSSPIWYSGANTRLER